MTARLKPILIIIIIVFFNTHSPWAATDSNTQNHSVDKVQVTTGIAKIKPTVDPQLKKQWKLTLGKMIWAAVFFFCAFFLMKYLVRILEVISERWTGARLVIKRIIPIIHILGWTLICYFIVVGVIGPPIETLLALTASAGIALGFASQDILKNIFGGIMILFDRPFQVGDKIQVKDSYGEVVHIGLRSVRIVTPDDSLVSIPNSEIVNQAVVNSNAGEFYCQVVAEFFLPPEIDLIELKKYAYRSAAVSRYVYLNKPISIIIKNEIHEGRSLLKLRLKAYVLDLRFEFPFSSEMTETLIETLLANDMVTKEQLSVH